MGCHIIQLRRLRLSRTIGPTVCSYFVRCQTVRLRGKTIQKYFTATEGRPRTRGGGRLPTKWAAALKHFMSENQVLQSLYTAELCNRNTFYEFLRWGQNEILPWETSPHQIQQYYKLLIFCSLRERRGTIIQYNPRINKTLYERSPFWNYCLRPPPPRPSSHHHLQSLSNICKQSCQL